MYLLCTVDMHLSCHFLIVFFYLTSCNYFLLFIAFIAFTFALFYYLLCLLIGYQNLSHQLHLFLM